MTTRSAMFFAGLAILIAMLASKLLACTPEAKQAEAATGFLAQQMRCIEQYADREHIDVCRERVRATWAFDAGKDGTL